MRPKILLLCLSPDFGGLEQHVRDYALWLSRRDDIELLLALRDGTRLHQALAELGGRTLLLKPGSHRWPWKQAGLLARTFDTLGIDYVHTHWRKDLPLAALATRRAKRRPRLAHTQHMLLAEKSKRDPYHALLYRTLDGFIAVTQQLAQQAQRWLPLRPGVIRTVYPGVPALDWATREAAQTFNIGVIGRILPAKGQHLALEACARLRAQGIPARAVFAGEVQDNDYARRLQEFAQEHALDVEWRGFVAPDAAFAGLHALAMCTDAETFGLVTAEALRRGVPVVGSDSGGTREILDDGLCGLLFPPGDSSALASRLERLYREPALAVQLIDAGYRRAAQEFDAETQFGKTLAALRSL